MLNAIKAKTKFFKGILIGFCAIATLYLIITPIILSGIGTPPASYTSFNDGWTVYADGQLETENASLPYFVKKDDVKTIDIYNTVPKLTGDFVTSLQFLLFQKNVKVFIDDVQIYEKVFKPSIFNKNVTGSGTCIVGIPADSVGKQIHLEIEKVSQADKGAITKISLIDGSVKPYNRIFNNNFLLPIMVSLTSMGLIALLVAVFLRKAWASIVPLIFVSIILISISIWTLCNSRMIEFFTTNWVLIHNLEYISFYLMPLSILTFIKHNWKDSSKPILIINDVCFAFFVSALALKVFFGIDFFLYLLFFHLLVVLVVFIIAWEMLRFYKKRKASFKVLCMGSIILAIAVCIEIVIFYSITFSAIETSANVFILGLAMWSVTLIFSFILSTKENLDNSFNLIAQTNLAAEHKRYETIISNTKDIFLDWNLADDTVYFSNRFEEYFGIKPFSNSLIKNTKLKMHFVKFDKDIVDVYNSIMNGGSEERLNGSFLAPDKSMRFFENTITSILDSEGKPINIIGIIKDTTKERMLADSYASQNEHMQVNRELYDNILEADITKNTVLGENSKQFLLTCGLPNNTLYSSVIASICENITHPDFKDEYAEIFSRERILSLFEKNITSFLYDYQELTADATYQWVRINVRIYRSDISGTVRIISYFKNIHNEKIRELALVNSSQNDSLSGLLNKGATKTHINDFLNSPDNKLNNAFIMFDIDRFKNINDTFGHAFGDTVITEIGKKLKTYFRGNDILGRIGGDEFVAFIKNVQNDNIVVSKCNELLQSFNYECENDGKTCKISLSIGITISPSHGTTYDELYANADIALYHSKDNGRNQYTFFKFE